MIRTGLEANHNIVELLHDPRVVWCRARVLRVLGRAAAQGTLAEVLGELLDEGEFPGVDETIEGILRGLREAGWVSEEECPA